MNRPSRAALLLAVKLALLAGVCALIARRLANTGAPLESLLGVDIGLLALVLLLRVAVRGAQALQVSTALRVLDRKVAVTPIAAAQLVASYYTMILPGAVAGGGVTWYRLRERGGGAAVAAALVFVNLVNLLVMIPIAASALVIEPRAELADLGPRLALVGALLAAFTAPFLAPPAATLAVGLLRRGAVLVPAAANAGERLGATLESFARGSATARALVVATAIVIHGINLASLHASALAIGFRIPLEVLVWLLPLIVVIHAVPLTFAGTGLRELGLVYVLSGWYRVPEAEAVALGLLIFLTFVVTGVLPGALIAHIGARRPPHADSGRADPEAGDRREGRGRDDDGSSGEDG